MNREILNFARLITCTVLVKNICLLLVSIDKSKRYNAKIVGISPIGSMTYTTDELIKILDRELKENWKG